MFTVLRSHSIGKWCSTCRTSSCFTFVPVRNMQKDGATGDRTRHYRLKLKIKYSDIPRIPGVTYMPQEQEEESGLTVPDDVNTPLKTVPRIETTFEGPKSVNPNFFNRNPRNLEMMSLAIKRTGWGLEAEQKEFYNKIVFERTQQHTRASIVHSSGRIVVSASTEEFGIAKHLYRTTDASAAQNIGRILGQRMLETGIMAAFCGYTEEERKGSRMAIFLRELTDFGIQLQEPERITRPDPFEMDTRHLTKVK